MTLPKISSDTLILPRFSFKKQVNSELKDLESWLRTLCMRIEEVFRQVYYDNKNTVPVAHTQNTDEKIISPDTTASVDVSGNNIIGKTGGATRWKIYSNGIQELLNQSSVRVVRGTAQSIPNDTWTVIQYDTVKWDEQNEWDNTNHQFKPKKWGRYLVVVGFLFDSYTWSAGSSYALAVYHGSNRVAIIGRQEIEATHTGYYGCIGRCFISELNANEALNIRVIHSQGTTINLYPYTEYNYLEIMKLA